MTASKKCFCAVLLAWLGGGAMLAANADEFQGQSSTSPQGGATVLYHPESVLGKRLVSASGENAGRIVDVIADATGQVRAAVVDYGGFLGIGTRKIAVAWSDLRFGSGGRSDAVATDLSREYLARAPQVRPGQPVIAVTAHRPFWHRAAQK